MKSIKWSQEDAINAIRQDLWRYLSPDLQGNDLLLEASALLQLPLEDVSTLGSLHFLLSEEVQTLLEAMPKLARRLATTTEDEEEWSRDRIRGPVNWIRTIGARSSQGWPSNLHVTTPINRAYQTPENELLIHVLRGIDQAGIRLGGRLTGANVSREQSIGVKMQRHIREVRKWLNYRPLMEVDHRPISSRNLTRVRQGRKKGLYRPAIEAYDRLLGLVERMDTKLIRQVVELAGLAPSTKGTLFELLIMFMLLKILRELGWELEPFRLLSGSLEMRAKRRGAELHVWYQRAPPELVQGSIRSQILERHQIGSAGQRPDIVVRIEDSMAEQPISWLLLECKNNENVAKGARMATADLLAYRRSFASVLQSQNKPYGIGVTWGQDLAPQDTEIKLCTPDRLADALASLVG